MKAPLWQIVKRRTMWRFLKKLEKNCLMIQKSHCWPYTPRKPELKEKSEKVGLKFNIQKMKIMASGPITSWEIDGEAVETVSKLFLGTPKSLQMVTAAMKLKDAYSLEGKL